MINIIEEIVKEKLGPFSYVSKKIETTNNYVHIIKSEDKEYIFKIYNSKNWPEDGKLLYVNSLLKKHNIAHPKAVAYDRSAIFFKGGYVLEEKIEGIAATSNSLQKESIINIYQKLAVEMKKVHSISFDAFGYLNNGNPCYDSLKDYVEEVLSDNIYSAKNHGLNIVRDAPSFVKKLCLKLEKFKRNAVLCHGDLSIRNVIYNKNSDTITLIDWDDAMALPAYADIARMTYDMLVLHENNYLIYKEAFLNNYFDTQELEEYLQFEKLYHIFVCFDSLSFWLKKENEEKRLANMINYLTMLIEDCKLQ